MGVSPYFSGLRRERAAIPKKVWKTSIVLPGLSLMPPSSWSWQWRMKSSSASLSIQSYFPIIQKVE
jgi:hypothetical protein